MPRLPKHNAWQKVCTNHGTYMTQAWRTTHPGLVIIQTESPKVPSYSVTHKASGKSVVYADSLDEAKVLVRLLYGIDWNADHPDFTRQALEERLGDFRHRAAYLRGVPSVEPGGAAQADEPQ